MKTCHLLAAMLVLLPGAAAAQRMSKITGKQLLASCSASQFSSAKVENCEAYLDGVADTFAGFMKFGPKDAHGKSLAAVICIPPEVTAKSLRLDVIRGLQDHPELQSRLAVEAVQRILRQAYPCGQGE